MTVKIRHFASLAFAAGLAACASAHTQAVDTYAGAPLPRPDRIIVYDFAVSPEQVNLDQGIGPRFKRMMQDQPAGADEREAAYKTQAALTKALTHRLQSYGLLAQHGGTGITPSRGSTLLIRGQIVSIDEGNRARRVMIGLGAGKSSVTADAQLYYAAGTVSPRLISSFEGSSDSGHAPGMAETMGGSAVAGHVASSAAVGGALHAGSEHRGAGDDANAERLADSLAKQIGQFAVSQGWIQASAVQ